ncbi:MAG: RNA pseudouridine synthase [Bdellovibrionales bacterium]|nr:RNA pseudouridine synthase [Bdellovibrionales bacterium]
MGQSSILSQNLKVLYEDSQIIAVFKPHRVLTQADDTGDESLFEAVKAWIKTKYSKPGNVFLGLIHRLDRPAAGIVVFAKTSKAASRLSEQIRNHAFKKKYRTWVSKSLNPAKGSLVNYLDFNKQDRKALVYSEPKGDRQKAILNYQSIRSENGQYLLEIELITGRKHQIRAQLAALGSPIVGDKKYGAKDNYKEGVIALEACYVSFLHPTLKEMIEIKITEEESGIIGGFI